MAIKLSIKKTITLLSTLTNKTYKTQKLNENLELYKDLKSVILLPTGNWGKKIRKKAESLEKLIIKQLHNRTVDIYLEEDIDELNMHMCTINKFNPGYKNINESCELLYRLIKTELEISKEERSYSDKKIFTYLSNIMARNHFSKKNYQKSEKLLHKYAGDKASHFIKKWKKYDNIVSPIMVPLSGQPYKKH